MSVQIGQQLRQARQTRNLTLEQVSRVTFIRVRFLEAIESGNLDTLPSTTQARGFLRTYASYLGVEPAGLLAELDRISTPRKPVQETVEVEPEIKVEDRSTDVIYLEIGRELRHQRESLGLTIDEVENQTRIRSHYLKAIEEGAIASLPSPVQARGMLNNYAAFIGLDPDPLLLKYAEALQLQLAVRRTEAIVENRRRGRSVLGGLISSDLLIVSTLVIGLLIFVIWAVGRISSLQEAQQPDPTAPAIVDVLFPSSTPTHTPVTPTATTTPSGPIDAGEIVEITPTPDLFLPLSGEEPIQVYIIARQRAWMRVTVDGDTAFEGRVVPGSAYPFAGRETIEVLTGSGSALQVFYNQEDLGPLGLFGEVVNRVFTADGILFPTPTITPTPTETPLIEETPTALP
jgi:cytoskeletal protein RodZ